MDRTATIIAVAAFLLTCTTWAKPPAGAPTIRGEAQTQPLAATQPADETYPDVCEELNGGLKFHMQADTLDNLLKQAKPDFTWTGALIEGVTTGETRPRTDRDLMWITTDVKGNPTFRMERALMWEGKNKAVKWVLPEQRDDYQHPNIDDGLSLPVHLTVEKKPARDQFRSYAVLKGQHPKWGEVYELCWVPEVVNCRGSHHWWQERLIYVWQDASKKWHLIGEGPPASSGHDSGLYEADSQGSEIRWRDGQPTILIMITSIVKSIPRNKSELYQGFPTLETRQDSSLTLGKDGLAGTYKCEGGKYLMTDKGDSLDKIVARFTAWQGGLSETEDDKVAEAKLTPRIVRKLIQDKNPKIDWAKLKPRQRIELPSDAEIDKALTPPKQ